MKKVFRFLVIVVISHTMQSQNLKELYNQSVAFYKVKDYSNFLIITRKLDSLRPSHPTYTYNLACAYALNNDVSNGLNTLKNVILMNNKTSFEDEPDLESLKNFKEFDDLVELKKDLNLIKSTSKKKHFFIRENVASRRFVLS